MPGFLKCFIYLAVTSLSSFFIGRILPKKWFQYDQFPYHTFPFERDARIYTVLGIRKWKDKLPDMGRVFPQLMPPKTFSGPPTAAQVNLMLQETCIAECIHTLLCVMGFGSVFLWNGIGGWIISVIFMLGNIPFNLIQRYNRPKLIHILRKLQSRKIEAMKGRRCVTHEERIDFELQYGTRT